jgi:hypothetical protein
MDIISMGRLINICINTIINLYATSIPLLLISTTHAGQIVKVN